MPTFTVLVDLGNPGVLETSRIPIHFLNLVGGIEERGEELGVQLQDDRMDVKLLFEDFEANVWLGSPLLQNNRLYVVCNGVELSGQCWTSIVEVILARREPEGGIFGKRDVTGDSQNNRSTSRRARSVPQRIRRWRLDRCPCLEVIRKLGR